MKIRILLTLTLAFFITACSGAIQFGSISEAYKHYEQGNYEKTLVLISRAENAKEMNAEQKAEITYLKAQTYEKLGQTEKATTLYQYILDQYSKSQYAYLIRKKLKTAQ